MSVPEEKRNRDHSCYDRMTTEELEQLLRLDFQAAEEEEHDLEVIFYISDLLAKRKYSSGAEAAWEQFQSKYRPYADGHSLYEFDSEKDHLVQKTENTESTGTSPRVIRYWRRLPVLVAAMVACLLGSILMAQATGVNLLNTIVCWSDETFRFRSGSSANPSIIELVGQDKEFREKLQELGVAEQFPSSNLDWFTAEEPVVTVLDTEISVYVEFTDQQKDRTYSIAVTQYTSPTNNKDSFVREDAPVEILDQNGQTFYIYSDEDILTAISFDGTYLTLIRGALTMQEMKAIISTIGDL